jgi:transcription elongation factor GreA
MSYLLDKPLPFIPEGKDQLAVEIAIVEACRDEILAELEGAPDRIVGALREELEAVDVQLCRLRHTLSQGVLVPNAGLVVAVGSEVTVADDHGNHSLTIAGPVAANPNRGCISYDSPLGRALLGAELGEHLEITSEGSHTWIRVVGIRKGRPVESAGIAIGCRQLVATG